MESQGPGGKTGCEALIIVIYEASFIFGTHPLVFWSGVTLILAGGL
jgi:hypothetical protein